LQVGLFSSFRESSISVCSEYSNPVGSFVFSAMFRSLLIRKIDGPFPYHHLAFNHTSDLNIVHRFEGTFPYGVAGPVASMPF
jgi:hypothetical protein